MRTPYYSTSFLSFSSYISQVNIHDIRKVIVIYLFFSPVSLDYVPVRLSLIDYCREIINELVGISIRTFIFTFYSGG